jgi:HEPN domain-containing protein
MALGEFSRVRMVAGMGARSMNAFEDAQYRLKIAQGFLAEARQDVKLERWRSGVDNAQLTVGNGVKAVLALLGPVGRTHNPAALLRLALDKGRFPAEIKDQDHYLPYSGRFVESQSRDTLKMGVSGKDLTVFIQCNGCNKDVRERNRQTLPAEGG